MDNAQIIALGGIIVLALFVVFATLVMVVVARWRLFTKASEKGWKSIIPFYSSYTMYKIAWSTKNFWIYLVLWAVYAVTTLTSGQYAIVSGGQMVYAGGGNSILGVISTIASLGILLYSVIFSIKLALAYGKRPTFAIGLLLLPGIFTLILAFGSAEYQGPQL